MKKPFTFESEHSIKYPILHEQLENLPEALHKHTNWEYTYIQTNRGCLLKPTFRKMPYKTSFVPEIDIAVTSNEDQTVLQMIGRPTSFVRIFLTFWFGFLFITEILLLSLMSKAELGNPFVVLVPLFMCVLGYLVCKISIKSIFKSVIKVIKEEFS